MKTAITIRTAARASHAYLIEAGDTSDKVHTHDVTVHANTRTQAASVVRKAGYHVRSVNMIG